MQHDVTSSAPAEFTAPRPADARGNVALLAEFVAAYPAQPATAYLRAIEIGALVRFGLPQGHGLDLGCGDGILTDIILRHVGPRSLVGIDPDPLETEAAKRFPFYQRVHVAPGDAIPEPSGSFDFVISNSVLEHVPDIEPTIEEVSRLLRPGGQYVFTVPAPAFRDNLRGPIVPGVGRQQYLDALDRRLVHLRYLSVEDWRELSRRHGLEMDGCLGYLDAAETRRWESLSRMTGGLLHALTGGSKRPIEIQRGTGMRAMQNRARLPAALARAIGAAVSIGAAVDRNEDRWLDVRSASCFLVHGRKP